MTEAQNQNNDDGMDWEILGELDFLFADRLIGKNYGVELRTVLMREFNVESFSLFSYDLEKQTLFDMIDGAPLGFNVDTPFLSELRKTKEIDYSARIQENEDSHLAWIYCRIHSSRLLILLFEDQPQLDKTTILKIRGILRIWYMRVQFLKSENKRERLLEQITQFRSIGEELARSHKLEDILTRILQTAIRLVDAEKGHIMVYDDETGELKVRIAKGFGSPETDKLINEGKIRLEGLKVGEGIQGKVFQTRRAMRLNEKNPLLGVPGLDTLSVICVPLAMNDEAFGVLHITNKKNWEPFAESDLDIINILATNVAAVLNKQKLFKRSSQDHLTNLCNRAYFEEKAKSELSRSLRYKNPFSLLLLDVDFFKKVNDTYGHLVGDDVLKFVSSKIKGNLRTDIDLPARFGGEEFVIILPETNQEGALIVAERIRKSIENGSIYRGGNTIQVTVSIGVTQAVDGEPDDMLILYERADLALYYCKENGRNQCNIYNSRKMIPVQTDRF